MISKTIRRKKPNTLWDEVTKVASKIVKSDNEDKILVYRDELFSLLDKIEKKSGPVADTLSTRADYIRIIAPYEALHYHKKAFALAKKEKDYENQVMICDSILDIYIEDLGDIKNAKKWISTMDNCLQKHQDVYYSEKYNHFLLSIDKIEKKLIL